MSGLTVATYFSGGGLKTIGCIAAGFAPVLAVEYNPDAKIGPPDAIASVYADNLGDKHLRCEPVQSVPESVLRSLEGVDLFALSPVCKQFSVANATGAEAEADITSAEASARAIRLMRPRAVMLENVTGYRASRSFRIITDTLDELGYWWQADHLNSADYSVPQTRRRLILRAVRDGYLLPLQPTHREGGGNGLKPWVGWYEAIADSLPDCPDSALAPWQLKRLPEELRTVLVNGIPDNYQEYATTPLGPGRPAPVLTSSVEKHPLRAVLVEGDAAGDRPPATLSPESPAFTIKTPSGGRVHRVILCGVNGEDYNPREADAPAASVVAVHAPGKIRACVWENNQPTRPATIRTEGEPFVAVTESNSGRRAANLPQAAVLAPSVRVVSLTLRCLARFQSMPDWYRFPAKKSLGCVVVGNGLPCGLAQAVAANLRDSLETGGTP